MKILIIGSKGFIGSYCFRYFSQLSEYKAYGADIATDYTDQNYFQIDASNSNFTKLFKTIKFDWCINCSGASSVSDSFKNPLRDFNMNVHNVVQILVAIKDENPSCKFIQLSSAAVYGNPINIPITEDSVLNPLSPYGIHKKQAEELCELYHSYFDMSIYILRIFSAYGPGLKKQLFWDLDQKLKANSTVSLYGTGSESRDFIHVHDIVICFELIIKNIKKSFEILNIANGKGITVDEAVHTYIKQAGLLDKKVIFSGETRTGDPLYWQADINKMISLGYTNTVELENGLKSYKLWLNS